MSMIDIASGCNGTGVPPSYKLNVEGQLELLDEGDLYTHEDGMLGFSQLQQGKVEQFDAFLETGCYDVTADAIDIRVSSLFEGRRPGFGNPNGESPMRHGTNIRFKTNGLRIGALNPGADDKAWIDLRMSLPIIRNIGLYRDPSQPRSTEIGAGAAIWLDMVHDSTTISDVRVAISTFGLLSTCFTDTIRVHNLHTADVDFPVYFAGEGDMSLPGEKSIHWANSLTECCFADGNGPCVIKGVPEYDLSAGWQFNNVHIVRQGRVKGVGPETCNLYWTSNGGQIRGGLITDPGAMLSLNDGGSFTRESGQIDADGMVLGGSRNYISTFFAGASGIGRANLRLLPGAHHNIIHSSFNGGKNGAVDLIIPEGCSENVVLCVPGMKIVDNGEKTRFVNSESAIFQS